MASDDPADHELVLREVARAVSEMDLGRTPPHMGKIIHRIVRDTTGNTDPYCEVKRRFNDAAARLYPYVKERVRESTDPFEAAVRVSIAGNIIDFGKTCDINEETVRVAVDESLVYPINRRAVQRLRNDIARAPDILYLGDNAGEIVFDRVLIEELPLNKVTFVVRGGPTINDATMIDAVETGMAGLVNVIDNGSDAPGTILDDCSAEFALRFQSAGLVIAKGQGNYETLSTAGRDVCYLLLVKCSVIAADLGCDVGSLIVGTGPRDFGSL